MKVTRPPLAPLELRPRPEAPAPAPAPAPCLLTSARAPVPRDTFERLGRTVRTGEGRPAARDPARRVYRIVYDRPVTGARYDTLRWLYGAEVLFDPTLARPGMVPSRPLQVPGIVLHNDVDEDPRVFLGAKNPALPKDPLYRRLSDKWEEHLFLAAHVPQHTPRTIRADVLSPRPMGSAEERLRDLARALDEALGRWILKPRLGFGSDGALPSSDDDLPALWSRHLRDNGPVLARIAREELDRDRRVEREIEELPEPAGPVLEALLADPASIVAQELIEGALELRVHVVEGRLLTGATTTRWWEPELESPSREIERAERVATELTRAAPGISFAADVLVGPGERATIIDLNVGLESGMYQPENDLYIAHLLSERLSGVETPLLAELRAFERAPLPEKLARALRLEARAGAFVRAHESFGLYDRFVSAYLAEVERDSSPARIEEALRQLRAIPGLYAEELSRFRRHPAVARLTHRGR